MRLINKIEVQRQIRQCSSPQPIGNGIIAKTLIVLAEIGTYATGRKVRFLAGGTASVTQRRQKQEHLARAQVKGHGEIDKIIPVIGTKLVCEIAFRPKYKMGEWEHNDLIRRFVRYNRYDSVNDVSALAEPTPVRLRISPK